MVTDEMVEKAVNAIAEKRGYVWPGTFDAEEIKIGRENIRAALEAALSAADPIGFGVFNKHGDFQFACVSKEDAEKEADWEGDTIRHIYAAPPSLSAQVQEVAVAEIVSAHGDPEAFGERELVALIDIQKFPYRTKLYAAAPAVKQGEVE